MGQHAYGWRAAVPAACLLAATALSGSSGPGSTGAMGSRTATAAPAAPVAVRAPAAADGCTPQNMTRSVPPSTDDSGPKVSEIIRRNYLVVGVDQNSYRWGYLNPSTGGFEGFDIELVRAVGKAVLGPHPDIRYKTVPTAQRVAALRSGEVDLIARTMTISCERLGQVAFSTAYFEAGQQVIVPRSSGAENVDQALRGRTVCAADGSTAQDELKKNPHGATVRTVDNQLDCLVLMQQGLVEATMTDNALGAGQVAQDPTVRLIGRPLTSEPYGVAMNRKDTDLVARVNAVLEDYRKGPWQQSYHTWLEAYLGPSAGPPAPQYLP
jgi:polar amino acid transport system substrate-binding protein